MPCSGYISLQDEFPRLWKKALDIIAKQMIANGWNKHAGKFNQVQMRKARKLFPTLIGI